MSIFYLKRRKAGRNKSTGGPRENHSIMTNSKMVKRISGGQKILSETLLKFLLQIKCGIINFKFTSVFEFQDNSLSVSQIHS